MSNEQKPVAYQIRIKTALEGSHWTEWYPMNKDDYDKASSLAAPGEHCVAYGSHLVYETRRLYADPWDGIPLPDRIDAQVLGYTVKGNRFLVRPTRGEVEKLSPSYEKLPDHLWVELVDRENLDIAQQAYAAQHRKIQALQEEAAGLRGREARRELLLSNLRAMLEVTKQEDDAGIYAADWGPLAAGCLDQPANVMYSSAPCAGHSKPLAQPIPANVLTEAAWGEINLLRDLLNDATTFKWVAAEGNEQHCEAIRSQAMAALDGWDPSNHVTLEDLNGARRQRDHQRCRADELQRRLDAILALPRMERPCGDGGPYPAEEHPEGEFLIWETVQALAKGECTHDFEGRAPDGGPISIQQPVHYICTKCGKPEED